MSYTTPQDIKDRWIGEGDLPPDSVLQTFIDDAEDTVLAAVPDLAERIADGRIPVERLIKIVCQMVIRHIKNPEGYRQMQETTGPFTRGYTHGGDEPGAIWLTGAERRELLGAGGGMAFQVDTGSYGPLRSFDSERAC